MGSRTLKESPLRGGEVPRAGGTPIMDLWRMFRFAVKLYPQLPSAAAGDVREAWGAAEAAITWAAAAVRSLQGARPWLPSK